MSLPWLRGRGASHSPMPHDSFRASQICRSKWTISALLFKAAPRLAEQHRLTGYDAAYLELALRLGLPLATLDQELIQSIQGRWRDRAIKLTHASDESCAITTPCPKPLAPFLFARLFKFR